MSVQAANYLIDFFRTQGVTNATYSFGIGGWNRASFLRTYGDPTLLSKVDYLQYNAYNHGTDRSAYAVFQQTYAWLAELPPISHSKKVLIGEWGCSETRANQTLTQGQWIATVPAVIAQSFGRIKAMSYFNSGWGTLAADGSGLSALVAAYDDPLFG